MNADYVLTCGIIWDATADTEAGWELVEALQSADPRLQLLAQTMLAERGEESLRLLERALEMGIVCTEAAGPCMVEILRGLQANQTSSGQTIQGRLANLSIC